MLKRALSGEQYELPSDREANGKVIKVQADFGAPVGIVAESELVIS
jgi:hypothetical protein